MRIMELHLYDYASIAAHFPDRTLDLLELRMDASLCGIYV